MDVLPRRGPGLDDVVESALRNSGIPWKQFRPAGAAGSSRYGRDSDFENVADQRFGSSRNLTAADRILATELGRIVASEVPDLREAATELNRLAAAIVAQALVESDDHDDADRTLLVTPQVDRKETLPPVVLVLSSRVERLTDSRVISDGVHLPVAALASAASAMAADSDGPPSLALEHVSGSKALLIELFLIARPEVVRTRLPRMVPLCVPSPAVPVSRGGERSTSGVFCRDEDGVFGVTACFHGTGPVGTQVLFGGVPATISRANEVQDIVFIPLDRTMWPLGAGSCAGVLSEREPAKGDRVRFDGATNPMTQSRVQSTDAGLLRRRPSVQLKVQTSPDTDHGDSGSALLDVNDRVLGFAFEQTDYDDFPQFTDWIWADNALASLHLSPV